MGADNLAGLSHWRCARRILSDYETIVYPRTGFDSEKLLRELREYCRIKHIACHVRLIDAPLVDISSTEIRKALAHGEDVSKLLM